MQETETVTQTENEETQAQGITESQATDSQSVEESESNVSQDTNSEESLDAAKLKKELDQARMELNQKRNALAEVEKQKEEARLAELSEVERLREELAQRDEERAQQEAIALRDRFINEYPDEKAREAAKKLVAENPSNLSWGDVQTEDEAKAAIHRQMDAIKAVIGTSEPEEQEGDYTVHSNNPAERIGDRQLETLSAAQMREVLPKADPR